MGRCGHACVSEQVEALQLVDLVGEHLPVRGKGLGPCQAHTGLDETWSGQPAATAVPMVQRFARYGQWEPFRDMRLSAWRRSKQGLGRKEGGHLGLPNLRSLLHAGLQRFDLVL